MKKIKALIFDWGDTLMRDFTEYPGAMFYWPKVEMIPGVDEALRELHTHFICCVASNAGASDSQLMGQALDRVGIFSYFHHLYTSKELGAAKPSPEFFHKVLEETGVESAECIMIGNDYNKDIAAAKAVGLHTILFQEKPADYPTPEADRVISSMSQLIDAVTALSSR